MKKYLVLSFILILSTFSTGCTYVQKQIDNIKEKELESRTAELSVEKQIEKQENIEKYGQDTMFLKYLYEQNYTEALIYYKVDFVDYMYAYIQGLNVLYDKDNPELFTNEVNQTMLLANDQNLNQYIEKQLKMLERTETYCELIYPSLESSDKFLKHMNDNSNDFISVLKNVSIFDEHYEEIVFKLIDYNELLIKQDKKLGKIIFNYIEKGFVFNNQEYYNKLLDLKKIINNLE